MKEMMEFTSTEFTSDMAYVDSPDDEDYDQSAKSETNNSDSSYDFNERPIHESPQICPLSSHTVKDYYSKFGVAILPEIPEELEEETTDNNFIDPKRISRISAKLEELNQKYTTVEILDVNDLVVSKKKLDESEKIHNIEFIPDYRENNNNKFMTDIENIKIKSCCSCPTYRIFLWKRKFRFCKDLILDNFFRPLFTALKDLHFYPTLLSKVSITLISIMYIHLAPYLAMQKNNDFKTEDTAFLLSYMAFSWCLFLVLLPLVITFNKKQLSSMFVGGLLLCACSLICKYHH